MDENKRKQIEAKLIQLFTQTIQKPGTEGAGKGQPKVIKVIRRRKGNPDLQVA